MSEVKMEIYAIWCDNIEKWYDGNQFTKDILKAKFYRDKIEAMKQIEKENHAEWQPEDYVTHKILANRATWEYLEEKFNKDTWEIDIPYKEFVEIYKSIELRVIPILMIASTDIE